MSPVRWEEGREGERDSSRGIEGSDLYADRARSRVFSVSPRASISRSRRRHSRSRSSASGWNGVPSHPCVPYIPRANICTRIRVDFVSSVREFVLLSSPLLSPPLSPSPLSDTIYQRLTVQEFLLTEREAQKFTLRACKRAYLHRRIHDTRTDREHL